jgi:serine/threonine protein kinase
MALISGAKLGPYEIQSQLGAGGMGEVYRARDTRLGRTVAIKILSSHLSSNPEAKQRFDREARAISSLSSPNICHLYDVGSQDGTDYLVMEYLEGETLADRLAKGPLPPEQVLKYGIDICEGLEKAHKSGVVHRDLKPGNLMLTKSGVKLMDFGLAKTAPASGAPSASLTVTLSEKPPLTTEGTVVGTFQYMSPEQVEGKDADARSDIFALGAVVYEMATGKRAFTGKSQAGIAAAILASEPQSISAIRPMSPPDLDRVVKSCIAKDPDERWQTAHDVKLQLRHLAEDASQIGVPSPQTAYRGNRERLVWAIAVAGLLAAALAALAIVGWLRPRSPVTTTLADLAFTIVSAPRSLAPVGDQHATPEISPDGSAVIFYGDGVQLRQLNKLTPEPVRTGSFRNPGFWSPDSRSFVFSDGVNLKKMRVPDGAPEIIANDVATLLGGSWSDNGTFLFAAVTTTSDLYAVPAAGGVAKRIELTGLPGGNPAWPEFLPGSEDFLFLLPLLARRIEESEIYLATLRDGRAADPVLLMKNATAARYTPAGGGRILFVRNDNLYAQTLNRTARKLEGEPELVQQSVASSPAFGRGHFSVSRTGVVAWRPGTAGLSQVTIFDRQGREIGTAGSPTVVQTLKLAPDETRLLIGFNAAAWLLEPNRPGQLQLEQGSRETLWSPDGSKFLDAIPPGGKVMRVVERPVAGEGALRELANPPGLGRLEDVSPDGRTLLFSRGALDTAVFSFRLDGVQKDPKSLVQTGETISHARFSPDGRWIVYTASAGGGGGLYSGGGTYVQPYPGPGLRKQVTSRGNYPVWRKDGREVVYLDEYQGRNYVWSVPVNTAEGKFRAGTPSPLFPARLPASTFGDLNFLAVSRDGSRFYIPQAVEQPDSGVIHIRMGWAKQ